VELIDAPLHVRQDRLLVLAKQKGREPGGVSTAPPLTRASRELAALEPQLVAASYRWLACKSHASTPTHIIKENTQGALTSTTESGAMPPLLTPADMPPRTGWKRMPSTRAARMVSSSLRGGMPDGCGYV
jgi:hypothetical protein